jgi:hypothetical protein
MGATLSFNRLHSILVSIVTQLPDRRTRPNAVYEIADAALGAPSSVTRLSLTL